MGLIFKTEVQGRPLWECGPIVVLSKQQNEVRKTAACICEGKGGGGAVPRQRSRRGSTSCI